MNTVFKRSYFKKINFVRYCHIRKNVKILYKNEILPKSTKIKYLTNPKKTEPTKTIKKIQPEPKVLEEFRKNEVGIQMLSRNLHEQIFKNFENNKPNFETVHSCLNQLEKFGLHRDEQNKMDNIKLKLPPLCGKNLEEHFYNLGEEQSGPYRKLVLEILEGVPEPPQKWLMKSGWVRYAPNSKPEKISHPLEDVFVFDVETCLSAGKIPTMATAVSKDAWYGWVSKALIDEASKPMSDLPHFTTKDLIPLEPNLKNRHLTDEFSRPKIVIGHNVSFDRAKVREQYYFEKAALRFLDTMSLHISVSGITSFQRAMLRSSKKSETNDALDLESWKNLASLNNLSDVHELYCGSGIEKSIRDIFMEGSLLDIKNDFQNLMNYCAGDVKATYNVLKEVFPMFLERFPHPVTLAGMLELGTAYLPVNLNWNRYINDCDQSYEDLNTEAKFLLTRRADQACQLLHDEKYKEDIWLWDQDWSTQAIKLKKTITKIPKNSKTKNPTCDNQNLNKLESQSDPVSTAHISESIQKSQNDSLKSEKDYLTFEKQNRVLKIDNVGPRNLLDLKNGSSATLINPPINQKGLQATLETDNPDIDPLETKFSYLETTKRWFPARVSFLPGYPAWYRKLCSKFDSKNFENWVPGPNLISTSMQITPKLLNLCWEGYPLHYIREKGWGFLVPHTKNVEPTKIPLSKILEKCPLLFENEKGQLDFFDRKDFEQNLEKNLVQKEWWGTKVSKKKASISNLYKGSGVWTNLNLENCCYFLKLPHKDGPSNNVGNPLSRDFLNKFSDNVLSGEKNSSAEKVLSIARMCSYWRNNRDRIKEQMVVWLKNSEMPGFQVEGQYGAILPQVVVCGTLTRRAMEPTWMTASNAQKERIGSELRSIIQAPPGFSMVGADVDSQELWIASLLGDTYSKIHGGTPLGHMTLIGTKKDGTDMHSVTASAVGISRDHAKVINYARIYGAGQNFAERLLKQFNPTMSESEAKKKARKMFTMTKGGKWYRLRDEFSDTFEPKLYSTYQAFEIAKTYGKTIDEVFHASQWIGGTESAMFNRLEEIANRTNPTTPFLNSRLSRALEPDSNADSNRFLPTKINWVVQSGAVDFLHLMLVSMNYLMKNQIRFCLSFHDEIRYIVPNDLKYDAALAMHITNLLVRSFCSLKVGIPDLPMSIAFFSTVEVDTVLRKDCHMDCVTPSNPHGLEKGYKIKNGEGLTVQECIQKTGGRIKLWENENVDPKET